MDNSISTATSAAPCVHLTFDDGPDREWTPRVLDALAGARAHATFFVIGTQARREPALLRRIAAEGHEVGNHTLSHRHPWTMTRAAARGEVREGANIVADIVGRPARYFRPPHGRVRRCMTEEAHAAGQSVVLWDRSAIDWGPLGTADPILERLLGTRCGEILLMHDGRHRHNRPDQLMRVLPRFLAELQRRGWQAAPLDGGLPASH